MQKSFRSCLANSCGLHFAGRFQHRRGCCYCRCCRCRWRPNGGCNLTLLSVSSLRGLFLFLLRRRSIINLLCKAGKGIDGGSFHIDEPHIFLRVFFFFYDELVSCLLVADNATSVLHADSYGIRDVQLCCQLDAACQLI